MDQDAIIASREDLRALVNGETTVGELYDRNPQWGRRAALAALGGVGLSAFAAGSATAQEASGTIGPAETLILAEIDGGIVAEGETVTDLLEVRVYETEADIPDDLPEHVVALHG
ncbi:MAG: hypothetical protein ACOCR6_01840 [archaeon]